jgi:hypothetical protein
MALPVSGGTFRAPMNTVDSSLAGGTALGSMVMRLFTDFQDYLDPDDTPLTSSIKTGKTVNQKKVEWLNRFLSAHQVTLGANIADGAATSITLAAGDGNKVMVTDLLKIEAEIVWVTAISGDVLTVKRGMGGTTAVAHSGALTIDLLAPAAQENADSPLAPVSKGSLEYNYPQLFDYAVQVSNREDNTPDYEFDSGSRYDAYLQQVMKDSAIDLEKVAINGRRGVEDSAVLGSGKPTLMGGLDFFTDSRTDLSGSAISERTFGDVMQKKYGQVKSSKIPTKMYVGPFMKRAISSIWNASRYSDVKDEETTLVWRAVDTDFGKVQFVLSRYIPAGAGYLIDLSDISKHFYKGGEWTEVVLPSNGPYKRSRFTGDLTMVFLNNIAREAIVNISTNVVDYANM